MFILEGIDFYIHFDFYAKNDKRGLFLFVYKFRGLSLNMLDDLTCN
jgi:hypothetical protein